MISILSILVLAAHLIAIDLAMVAPLACIWLARRATRKADALAGVIERRLAWHSMLALALGMILGTAQLGLLRWAGDRDFFAAVDRVSASRLWFSLAELVFFFGCMAAYLEVRRWPRRIPYLAATLAVLAATDLMYHFPPLFAMLNLLATRVELSGQTLTGTLYRTLLLDPEVMAMVAHVWLAGVAVTGVAVMRLAIGSRLSTSSATPSPSPILSIAARCALAASLAQLPVGMWVLFTVPEHGRSALMGGDPIGSLLFVLAIVATLGLLHHLASAAFGDAAPAQVHRSVALILCVVLLMTAALDRSRSRTRDAAAITPAAASRAPALFDVSVNLPHYSTGIGLP